MIYYKLVKITINALGLAEIIIDVVVYYHSFPNSIVTDKSSFFITKFWSLLSYFFGIKRWLSTTFHMQTNGQTKKQNKIIKAYL